MAACLSLMIYACAGATQPVAMTAAGAVEGVQLRGVDVYKGVPFAAPPVGDLRWRAPQPVAPWDSVRPAHEYGPSPMQYNIYGDIEFGPAGVSEDCLYLNIWTPAGARDLPVLIYFNGGGLMCGNGAEPRYAGQTLAEKGIIVVTANYREGIFGFFSHPELSAETPYGSSGNYGFMDMIAAIQWVRDNIANFGGNPDRITIAGESAGSISVSLLMASPLCHGLFAQAIGSSGSTLNYDGVPTLQQAEDTGLARAAAMGAASLDELRAMPAPELLERSQSTARMEYCVDGYVLTDQPLDVYDAGRQMDIPLLLGGNSHEVAVESILWGKPATVATVRENAGAYFGPATDTVLDLYGIRTDADVTGDPGVALASDMFLGYTTWKWANAHARTASQPVYLYNYTHPRPWRVGAAERVPEAGGARHAADIEYAMGNLATNHTFDWQPEDYVVSDHFQNYYVNFVKTGNPNAVDSAAVVWPAINGQAVPVVLQLDVVPTVKTDSLLEQRYRYVDGLFRPRSEE